MLIQSKHIKKQTLLSKKLEVAYTVADYYKCLIDNRSLPKANFPSLEEALRCNRILKEYVTQTNLSIKKGIKLMKSNISVEQVVWTWQQLKLKKQIN